VELNESCHLYEFKGVRQTGANLTTTVYHMYQCTGKKKNVWRVVRERNCMSHRSSMTPN